MREILEIIGSIGIGYFLRKSIEIYRKDKLKRTWKESEKLDDEWHKLEE